MFKLYRTTRGSIELFMETMFDKPSAFRVLFSLYRRQRSSVVEQLICNQLVGGSTPSAGSNPFHPLE